MSNQRQHQEKKNWTQWSKVCFFPRLWRNSSTKSSQWWFEIPCHLLIWVFWSPQSKLTNTRHFSSSWCCPLLTSSTEMLITFSSTNIITKSWSSGRGVTVLDCPENRPDLNLIGNLWSFVKKKMRDGRPDDADYLRGDIKAARASIAALQCPSLHDMTQECCLSCSRSLPKYWVHRNDDRFVI